MHGMTILLLTPRIMPTENDKCVYDFPDALRLIFNGRRMTTSFLPENIFIELQNSDGGSMNTEPYLKMVQVSVEETENTKVTKIVKCEPWEPGRRSLFEKNWLVSKFNDMDL